MSADLIGLTKAEQQLATIATVDDAKTLAAKADAMKRLAKNVFKNLALQNHAALIKILAERRGGEIVKRMKPRLRGKTAGRGRNRSPHTGETYLAILKKAEIARSVADRWEGLASIPEAVIRRRESEYTQAQEELTSSALYVLRARKLKERTRQRRRNKDRDRLTRLDDGVIGDAHFPTIVIDPPWDWGDEGDQDQFGRARPTYDTLSIDEIRDLTIEGRALGDIADVDAHLYLWITNRSLPKGFDLLVAWGFRYVTCLTWCKPSIGMGNYFRGSTEQILFGVKGSQALKRNDVGTWFAWPRGEQHSGKPDAFYTAVESWSPGPFLDVFGRKPREGWRVWPQEVTHDD